VGKHLFPSASFSPPFFSFCPCAGWNGLFLGALGQKYYSRPCTTAPLRARQKGSLLEIAKYEKISYLKIDNGNTFQKVAGTKGLFPWESGSPCGFLVEYDYPYRFWREQKIDQ